MTLETWGVFALASNRFQIEARGWSEAMSHETPDLAAIVSGYLDSGDRLVAVLRSADVLPGVVRTYTSETEGIRASLEEGRFVTVTPRSLRLVLELGVAMHELGTKVFAFVKANDPR